MDGRMTIAMNTHQEMCVLQLTGGVAVLPDQVEREREREREKREMERDIYLCFLGVTMQADCCQYGYSNGEKGVPFCYYWPFPFCIMMTDICCVTRFLYQFVNHLCILCLCIIFLFTFQYNAQFTRNGEITTKHINHGSYNFVVSVCM